MHELTKTLDIIRKRIRDHKTDLSNNEAMTRYALIDPLLRALDWDVSDPRVVIPEEGSGAGSRTDYTMGKAMVVEAKKLDDRLDKYKDKLIEYVRKSNVLYGVLTNGQSWRMYDSRVTTKAPAMEFDVTDSDGVIIPRAALLYRTVMCESISQRQTEKPKIPKSDGKILIGDVKCEKGMIHPIELMLPNGKMHLKSWADMLFGVADWLVNKKHLDKSHCPVPIGKKNAILNTKPFHQNGKPFNSKKEVGKLFLNTNANAPNTIKYAIRLIEEAEQNPSNFMVRFEKPKQPGSS